MKWGIIVLVILGLAAAVSAAILMGALSTGSSVSGDTQPTDIEVAMAKVSLPAATVITHELITTELVSRDELPEGSGLSVIQIVGRVLAVPVVEGQLFTKPCFVTEGIGALLASSIPHGMRAFSVSVSSKSLPDSILLYPGAVVDVLVYYRLSGSNSVGESLSQTMLIGMKVLAVSGDSVMSKPAEEGGTKKRSTSRGRLVTLLVSTKQAEALMLAAEGGSLTMSLRNPLDRELVDEEASVLDRNSIGRKGETIQPTISNEQVLPGQWSDGDNPLQEGSEDGVPGTQRSATQHESTNKSQNSKNSSLDIEMIIGRVKTIENVDAPENKTDKTAPKK